MTFLPGLGEVVRDELVEVLRPVRAPRVVAGRDDALRLRHTEPLARVLRLRTAVAVFVRLHFDVPRPRSLTSGDHLARIVDAVGASLRVERSRSFRFEAAGADSAVFARLASLLAQATGLVHDAEAGELVVRVLRGTRASDEDPGWDVLVRVGPRPLSARTWRVADYPGAVNATIAAAMVRLAGVRAEDRVANLMCGSGTLLVERLAAGPAAAAVGVDLAPEAIEAATANLAAAGIGPPSPAGPVGRGAPGAPSSPSAWVSADTVGPDPRARRKPTGSTSRHGAEAGSGVRLLLADALAADDWAAGQRFDLVLADPPWGDLHGSHATNEALHAGLLRAAHAVTNPGARLVVLTHEVKVMARLLRGAADLWVPRDEVRVFAKGHHPRIYVLDRADGPASDARATASREPGARVPAPSR